MRPSLRMVLGTALGCVIGGLLPSATGAAWAGYNMMDQIIRGACLKAVNQEVKDSGKPAPDGMASSTCDCVVQQMKQRKSIEVAKTTCKNQAAEQYNL